MPNPIDNFYSHETAIRMLTENILDVYFVKRTDGTWRRMHCTLNLDHVPYMERTTASRIIAGTRSGNLPVWDILVGDWRSFYLDSVQEVVVSKIFDDTLEKVKEIREEELSEESTEGMSEEESEGLIESLTASILAKLTGSIEEAPEKLLEFSLSKIRGFVTRLILRK